MHSAGRRPAPALGASPGVVEGHAPAAARAPARTRREIRPDRPTRQMREVSLRLVEPDDSLAETVIQVVQQLRYPARMDRPAPFGLYDPSFEHDACGFGAVVRLSGEPDHSLVSTAIHVVERLGHRGATGADEHTGDGAGILVQLPDRFLRRVFREDAGIELPTSGDYAVGIVFLPRDPARRLRCEELCARIAAEEGHRALGWRDVPVVSGVIGEIARRSEPVIRMLAIERRTGDKQAFGRALYVIRRRIEKATQMDGIADSEFNFTSLSSRTIVYKGLLTAAQLAAYFPDLGSPDFRSAIALVHSRFSTNTLGTWDLAHPYNMLAHNGEINTIRGNHAWLVAREPQLRSEVFGRDLQKLFPIAEARWSDSAKLDAALELIVQGGRDLAHALAILIPPAWSDRTLEIPDDVRAFHEYHTALMEPWDGPAAIVATDGDRVVATLDRNGLRPGRFDVTRDGLVVLASEAGVLDIDPAEVVEAGRLEGGKMLVLDTISGRIVRDDEVKRVLARRQPYRQWLNQGKLHLDDLVRSRRRGSSRPSSCACTGVRLHERGPAPAARPDGPDGYEATGSMGDDTPLAALSSRPKLLAQYFKQHFAQVTNPPIDPVREEIVMHLGTGVGAMGNLLAEEAEACRRVILAQPILQNGDLEKLRHLRRDRFRAATLSTLYPVEAGAAGIQDAVDRLCREASHRVWDGHTIIILSDRGVDARSVAIPPILACAAVHSHLVREGARTMCSIVVESGEPRETMHFALLIGYGASAINPYVALDTLAVLQRQGELGELTLGEARTRYVQAIDKGLLKICSKMGISTIQSYRGAQIFEAVGLGPELIARYFPGTASRVGGLELKDIADENVERHRLPSSRATTRRTPTRRSSIRAASTSSACAARSTPGTRARWRRSSAPSVTTGPRATRPTPPRSTPATPSAPSGASSTSAPRGRRSTSRRSSRQRRSSAGSPPGRCPSAPSRPRRTRRWRSR